VHLRPTDIPELPWYGWFFLSASSWAVCVICQSFGERDRGLFTLVFAYLTGLLAIFSGAMGMMLWFRIE
jgi:hypothetical protein